MTIDEAQRDMRNAYLSGGAGVLVSSFVWMAAAILAITASKQSSLLAFFIGGMFIHPISILINKLSKRTGKHKKENVLGILALESTVIIFMGLFLVYSLFQSQPGWFFPIMLLIIGVRYLVFQTIYGMKIYWILGGVLMLAGLIGIWSNQSFYIFGLIGGIVEFIFSVIIILNARKNGLKILTVRNEIG